MCDLQLNYVIVSFMSQPIHNTKTKYHKFGGLWFINSQLLFLIVMEARKSKIMVPTRSFSVCLGTAFWFVCSSLSLCPHMAEEVRELCGVSFIKMKIPFMKSPPSLRKRLPKVSQSNIIIEGFNVWLLEEHKYPVYSTLLIW